MKQILILLLFMLGTVSVNSQANDKRNNSIIVKEGKWDATYYGNTYKGRRYTANGDVFNMNAMTCAAHKDFPFGTRLKVTNIQNGKSVIVKVTDRGGFANKYPNRLDLTYGAFGKIAAHRLGVILIKVEVLKNR